MLQHIPFPALPAPPGVLGAHNMTGWGAVPGSPSYSLISLEQAQQKARERTRSAYSATSPSSPASGVFPHRGERDVPQTRSRATSGAGDLTSRAHRLRPVRSRRGRLRLKIARRMIQRPSPSLRRPRKVM